MTDSSGQSVSFGSGFLVKEDMLVTNFHVINVDTVNGGYITGNGLASPVQIASVAYVDEAADIAVVKAQTPVGKPLILGSSSGLKIGAEVFVIGSPKGLGGTFSAGILSAMREVNQLFQLQISAPISSGSSGGPVLDHKGEVIGIAVSSIKTGQNLNFAIPVDYLIALLQGTRGRQLK
jgi:S1-C subfamily serine protease